MAKTPFDSKVPRTIYVPLWQDSVLAGFPRASQYIEEVLDKQPEFNTPEALKIREELSAKKKKTVKAKKK